MKAFSYILAITLIIASAQAQDPTPKSFDEERLAKHKQSLSNYRTKIEELRNAQPSIAALELGEIVWKTEKVIKAEGREDVNRAAREALFEIPGYGNYFVEKIATSKNEANAGQTSNYDTTRVHTFEILKLLATPEIVEILGNYLDDHSDQPPPVKPGQDYSTDPANDVLAARALGELIATPPLQKNPRMYGSNDVQPWKLWYGQVKAGNREFKFKGDDRVYRLSGSKAEPSVVPSAPDSISPERPVIDRTPETPEVTARSSPFTVPLILSLAVLGGAVVWLLVSKRRAKA